MKYYQIAGLDKPVSAVVQGCMRITGLSKEDLAQHIGKAMELGVNMFDHADIYGGGACESLFGEAVDLKSPIRDKMIIQSKCAIRGGYYDFSADHIKASVEGILSRLGTDYLDILLLHRPDALMEPEETAEAVNGLARDGKIRAFGVSNCNPDQIALLKKYVEVPIAFNQLQMSIVHCPMIDAGMAVNMDIPQSFDRTGGTIEYYRLNDITIQAWSPFQKGFFGGSFVGDREAYGPLNDLIDQLAEKYGVTPSAIAVAWLLRHPAHMQVILGTTSLAHLEESCAGADIELERKEWYDLYKAAGKIIP